MNIGKIIAGRLAEREGFEPPDGCPSTVFKTAAFDHSATSPDGDVSYITKFKLQH